MVLSPQPNFQVFIGLTGGFPVAEVVLSERGRWVFVK